MRENLFDPLVAFRICFCSYIQTNPKEFKNLTKILDFFPKGVKLIISALGCF